MNFNHKGIVLGVDDLKGDRDWISTFEQNSLDVIGVHNYPLGTPVTDVKDFVGAKRGRGLLAQAQKSGIEVEYELHVMNELLPRKHFETNPEYFRENRFGERVKGSNICPMSREALSIVKQNAKELATVLRPSNSRYHLWQDDNRKWCHCEKCSSLSFSDQTLIVMNEIVQGLKEVDQDAKLSYLAYLETIVPPKEIEPHDDIFLEYAPMERCFKHSISNKECHLNRQESSRVESLLNMFGTEDSQVLEYWLDASLFYRLNDNKPREIKFYPEVLKKDLKFYEKSGFEILTTFGVCLENYIKRYGQNLVEKFSSFLES